ncbi:hypothetical protein B0T19DRAFT_232045 [Cercophora scortea]|uniref:Uncharacterized protein n=1 Tax=Cercophora scortea TaxID=314031 RepID=A0AAE0IG66_9PEZI|nr:hypothetical protein B0T19DRAFT_232045 [Cercophora scortea]
MLVPGRRSSWQQQLRQTPAKDQLVAAQPELFPLLEAQEIANRLLKDRSPLFGRGIVPQSVECDILFANELLTVKGELFIHEAAILACLHLLSYDQARGQILSIQPSLNPTDVFFDHKLPIYLQCIIISRRANPQTCTDEELVAAQELLSVVNCKSNDFPSISNLLEAVGRGTCEALLPTNLVRKVLKKSYYRDNLMIELEDLRKNRKWLAAYKLVGGLRGVVGLNTADQLLRDVFPDYPMWANWRPDIRRITLWEGPVLAQFRTKLCSLLDLEGPDTTGQQRGTFRMSSPGVFKGLDHPGFSSDRHILDRLLDDLDASLAIGPQSVDLLIALCIDSNSLSPRSLTQLEAAIKLHQDTISQTLAAFTRAITLVTSPGTRLSAFTSALPLLTTYSTLQTPFGTLNDLARRGPAVMSESQKQFRHSLAKNHTNERLALNILSIGCALLRASWLHDRWQPAYIAMLRNLPTEHEIRCALRAISEIPITPPSPTRASHIKFLATRIGGLQPSPASSPAATAPTAPITIIPEDPIWYTTLEYDHDSLRRTLRSPGLKDLDLSVKTACLKQSLHEHDTFIRALTGSIMHNTDQACVNMAVRLLGPRIACGMHVHEAWKTLLLHLMRRRPPGLLERCGQELTLSTWQSWVEHLRLIFVDRHLDPEGKLGFTNERFTQWTQRKIGVNRSLSTSTYSTASTGHSSTLSFN